jgi:hypothetical protein
MQVFDWDFFVLAGCACKRPFSVFINKDPAVLEEFLHIWIQHHWFPRENDDGDDDAQHVIVWRGR